MRRSGKQARPACAFDLPTLRHSLTFLWACIAHGTFSFSPEFKRNLGLSLRAIPRAHSCNSQAGRAMTADGRRCPCAFGRDHGGQPCAPAFPATHTIRFSNTLQPSRQPWCSSALPAARPPPAHRPAARASPHSRFPTRPSTRPRRCRAAPMWRPTRGISRSPICRPTAWSRRRSARPPTRASACRSGCRRSATTDAISAPATAATPAASSRASSPTASIAASPPPTPTWARPAPPASTAMRSSGIQRNGRISAGAPRT